MTFFARTDSQGTRIQLLREHLVSVSQLASHYAAQARPEDSELAEAARAAGLLHDLGKYRTEFQELLAGCRSRGEATRHKQAGAARACALKRSDAAFAIGGHHGGLPDTQGLRTLIERPGGRDIADAVWPIAVEDCPDLASLAACVPPVKDRLELDLRVRLLFSCLVDADWLDSAIAVDPDAERDPVRFSDHAERWLASLLSFVRTRAASCKDPDVRGCRAEVLGASLARADDPPGLFSLTVPTGGGKTLSAMAFALRHAYAHGLRRIIYVAPYLSIIEQNAAAIRAAIGEGAASEAVLEHHSLSDQGDGREDDPYSTAPDRLGENWDAPVVITTSVQFFESLFARSPGRCRKVHNVARSVVILDECQSLPRELVAPTLDMLKALQPYLGATLVLCTATQPAWEMSDALPMGLEGVREIAPEPAGLADRLRRVRVEWPKPDAPRWSWEEAAARMVEGDVPALCVVNTKAAAHAVFLALRDRVGAEDGVFHLSTSMCPEHRRRVLAECIARLQDGRRCLLVSTQLVEAGVDIDFPLVLRELGPLDSIVQAAGRCNREGRLGREGGRVVVFRSEEGGLPPGPYTLATKTTGQWLEAGETPDTSDPETMRRYFRTLYNKTESDAKDITALRGELNFPKAARCYKLIDDDTLSVVVAGWEEERARVEALLGALARSPTRRAFRALAPYSVNLYRRDAEALGAYLRGWSGTHVTVCDSKYDASLGIVKPATGEALLA